MKTAPFGSFFSTHNWPPCEVIKDLQVASPTPKPCLLVVCGQLSMSAMGRDCLRSLARPHFPTLSHEMDDHLLATSEVLRVARTYSYLRAANILKQSEIR